MPAIGKVEGPEGCGSVWGTKGSTESLPLRLGFAMSAYNTVQRMIRFPDEQASFVFLFFGIILSIFLSSALGVIAFWSSWADGYRPGGFRALFYGLQTIAPRPGSPVNNPNHRRGYWCHHVLRYPVEDSLIQLRALSDEATLQQMAYELYAALAIERSRFDRINHCLRWAVTGLVVWVGLVLMTITS